MTRRRHTRGGNEKGCPGWAYVWTYGANKYRNSPLQFCYITDLCDVEQTVGKVLSAPSQHIGDDF